MDDRSNISRRRLLGATLGGLGLAALGATRLGGPVDAATGSLAITAGGEALAPAERLQPPSVIQRPPAGRIAFPLDPASDCYVLDNFGDCRGNGCSRLHEGVDIMGSRFQPVYAVADGRLTKRYVDSGLNYGAGNGWTLDDDQNGIVYKFFHLDRHEEGLSEGDLVTFGQVIGYVGKTGTSGPDNYHLHFEYRPGNVARDPFPLLEIDRNTCGVSPPIR